jgi:hypothetical protein
MIGEEQKVMYGDFMRAAIATFGKSARKVQRAGATTRSFCPPTYLSKDFDFA